MNIAIIGAGNGGQAMAGHFASMGHSVSLYNRDISKFPNLKSSKLIKLSGVINTEGSLRTVTEDISEAVKTAKLIMVTTTADAHRSIAKLLAPYLKEDQIVVLNPGRTLGAIEFAHELKKTNAQIPLIAETQSLLYACRLESEGRVRIIGIKDKVFVAGFPAKSTDSIVEVLKSIYNSFIAAENVLVTSLENIGAIFHPSILLLNAASIDRGEKFFFYNDITPNVSNFIKMIDMERLSIGKAFDLRLNSAEDWISLAYNNVEGSSLQDKIKNNPAYSKIESPTSLNSRYLTEEIPTGIVPMIDLGNMAGVDTPLLQALLSMGQALTGVDYRENGRTLANLGIVSTNKQDFLRGIL